MGFMTKEEYKIFKAKGELMGKLEQERRAQQVADPDYPANFLPFLDAIHRFRVQRNDERDPLEEKLQGKIQLRQFLLRFPEGTFAGI